MDHKDASIPHRNDHICFQCKGHKVAATRQAQYEQVIRKYLQARGLRFEDVFQFPDQDVHFTPVPRATVEVHPGTGWDLLAGFYSNFPTYEAEGMFVPSEPCPLLQRAGRSSDESTDESQRAVQDEGAQSFSGDIDDAVTQHSDEAVFSNVSDSGYCSDGSSEDTNLNKPSMKANSYPEGQSHDKDNPKPGDDSSPLLVQDIPTYQDEVAQLLLSQSSLSTRLRASITGMSVFEDSGLTESSVNPFLETKRPEARDANNKVKDGQETPLHLSMSTEDIPADAITALRAKPTEEWSAVGTEHPEAVSMRPDPTLRFRRPKNARNSWNTA